MEIEQADINSIKPYKNNPRKLSDKAITKVANSIKEFGFRQPIVVDKDRIIVVGHTRFRASKQLGLKQVPITIAKNLTPSQINAYRIADNRTNEEAEWNDDLLNVEIKELQTQDYALEVLGFDDRELDKILFEEKTGLTDDDHIPDDPKNVKTKEGDIIHLGDHRLLCGDATKKEDVDLLMDGKKADMVFTDPPWNVNYGENLANGKYKCRKIINDNMSTENFKSFINKSFISLKNSSKEGCMTYVVMSAQEWGNLMLTLKENDYHWSSTIIWNKSSLIISRKDYHTKYEPIWYGWLNGESRLKPLKDRKQSDVWDIKKPSSSKLHPTTKPIELVEKAVLNSSENKNIIIDLFLGSGSTLIACEKTNRKCYGMELDPHYCDVIVKRWEDFTGKKAERVERVEG